MKTPFSAIEFLVVTLIREAVPPFSAIEFLVMPLIREAVPPSAFYH